MEVLMKRSDVGATVRRISDSQVLTVIKVIDSEQVEVAWFDDDRKMHRETALNSDLEIIGNPLDMPMARPML
jgi:hypothetical protein